MTRQSLRSSATSDLARGVLRLLADLDIAAVPELPLASGRRVDVIGLARNGRIHVVEIKACREDYRADRKWQDYLEFADYFYFAVNPGFPRELLPETTGLILADRFGGELVRAAPERPLAAPRRKALTLRFARAAAGRLVLPLIEAERGAVDQLA